MALNTKYHTINTPEWRNSHNLKKDGGGRHLEFRKMSITPDWIKIYAPNYMEDASRPCGDDHVTKSRSRKLILVTSSNERLESKCVHIGAIRDI